MLNVLFNSDTQFKIMLISLVWTPAVSIMNGQGLSIMNGQGFICLLKVVGGVLKLCIYDSERPKLNCDCKYSKSRLWNLLNIKTGLLIRLPCFAPCKTNVIVRTLFFRVHDFVQISQIFSFFSWLYSVYNIQ